jgi:hypothetical protein
MRISISRRNLPASLGAPGLLPSKNASVFTIKLNFNGGPTVRLGHLPLGDTNWPHPNLLAATMHLMARAGVYRVRLVEGAAAPRAEFETPTMPMPPNCSR